MGVVPQHNRREGGRGNHLPDDANEENAKDDDDDDEKKNNNNVGGVAGYYAAAALEEKYARRLSVGCRRRRTISHCAANVVWSCTTPTREKRREEEEEEEEEDDDDALFSVPVKVEQKEEEEEEDEDEKEDGINKEMMVFRSSTPPLNAKRWREKIREANARLDEDVRRVRDVMEELMKAGDAASEYRYREEDEEENGRRRGGEEEEEERVPARDDETSEELLRLRKGLGIASSSSSTLTRKGASYWSVPAEDLVRQLVGEDDAKKMRGGLSAEEEPDDAGIDQTQRRIDAESLRSAGIL